MENSELLKIYRDQIDSLDKEMIYLLFRRFELVKQIWLVKKDDWIKNPLDIDRWEKLMKDNLDFAKEYSLNQDLIKDIWDMIHKESLKIEK